MMLPLALCSGFWIFTSAESLFNISGLNQLPQEPGLIISESIDTSDSSMNDLTINQQCGQKLAIGEGSMKLRRYYYDRQRDQCFPFVYKGSLGNLNNFIDENSCRITCKLNFEKTNRCNYKPEPSCKESKSPSSHKKMFYYHLSKNECRQFNVTKCDDNTHFFNSKVQCDQECLTVEKAPCVEIISCTTQSCPFVCMERGKKQYCCNEEYKD